MAPFYLEGPDLLKLLIILFKTSCFCEDSSVPLQFDAMSKRLETSQIKGIETDLKGFKGKSSERTQATKSGNYGELPLLAKAADARIMSQKPCESISGSLSTASVGPRHPSAIF